MMFCTLCGKYIQLFTTVRVALEISYETGMATERRNICPDCSKEIVKRNQWYGEFVNFFNSHPGRLEALELIHESELQL